MRIKSFYIYVFLFILCVITFDLGAGGGNPPNLVFTSWKAGQSPLVTGPYIQGMTTEVKLSFLTNEETKCELQVSVGYAADQPTNAYQLNAYEFEIDAEIILPGLSEEEQKKHTFTFPQNGKQNVAPGVTSFNYSAEGTLTEHWGPSGSKETRKQYCPNEGGTNIPEKGRKLKITVKFIGYFGTDPNNEQNDEIVLPLEQYEKDQMRQEYLDHRRLHRTLRSLEDNAKYGDLHVPSRSEFSVEDEYDNAHGYSYMINKNLSTKELNWTQACDKYVGEILIKPHRIESLHVSGGYRNPHHHVYHVDSGASASTKYWSYHQFGSALDVRTVNMDGDEKGIENTYATKWQDSFYMAEASRLYANSTWRKWKYGDGHVHADWRGVDSTSSERVSQTPEEQQNNPFPPTPTPPTSPSTITYACGIHNGDPSSESSDHNTTISGYIGLFYECQSHQTFGCGHKDLNNNSSSHALQASCSETDSYGQGCTVTSFYACQTHTHQYPALISGACGHTYTSGNANSHAPQASCTSTNANGHSCTVTSFYNCQSHTHVYPRTCWRNDCNEVVSDAAEHKETCGSGAHSFWPGCPDLNVRSWHQRSYHELRNCSRCGSQFRLCSNNNNSCSNGRNHRK